MQNNHPGKILCAIILVMLLGPRAGLAADTPPEADIQCVLQVEKESQVVVLIDLNAPPPLSPLAYPLTELGEVAPGDLVRVDRSSGATVEITQKSDPACLNQVPKGDPHSHHRKNMKP